MSSCFILPTFFFKLSNYNIRYLRIISYKIIKRQYTELSIRVNIYLSIFNIGICIDYTTVSKFQLNVDHTAMYDIVLLVAFSARCVHRTNRRAIAMMFVCLSVCLSGTGVHCDHTLQFSADLSLRLDSPMF